MRVIFAVVFLLSVQCAFSQELKEHYAKASMDFEGKVTDNQMVRFMTLDDITLSDATIPMHTYFYAPAKFTDDRVLFEVEKISVKEKVYAVRMAIVALDLKEGLTRDKKKSVLYLYSGDYKFLIKE